MSQQPQQPAQASYVVSQSGHAAHPDNIIASCRALQEHLTKLQNDAQETLAQWEGGIKNRDLAEKRRVAPGWLDAESGQGILVPQRSSAQGQAEPNLMDQSTGSLDRRTAADAGAELDRAFGGLSVK